MRYWSPTAQREILVCRPNQSHPTFPILFNSDDVPGRTLLALVHNHFLPRRAAIFNQLEVVRRPSFTQAHGEIAFLLCFTLESESTTLGLQGADLGIDVAI